MTAPTSTLLKIIRNIITPSNALRYRISGLILLVFTGWCSVNFTIGSPGLPDMWPSDTVVAMKVGISTMELEMPLMGVIGVSDAGFADLAKE